MTLQTKTFDVSNVLMHRRWSYASSVLVRVRPFSFASCLARQLSGCALDASKRSHQQSSHVFFLFSDQFCAVCFRSLHLKGRRAKHVARSVRDGSIVTLASSRSEQQNNDASDSDAAADRDLDAFAEDLARSLPASAAATHDGARRNASTASGGSPAFARMARFVPLRLNAGERTYLRLLEASVFVSV